MVLSGAPIDSVYRISKAIIANRVAKIAFKAPGLHRATTRAIQRHTRPMRCHTKVTVRETSINSSECLRSFLYYIRCYLMIEPPYLFGGQLRRQLHLLSAAQVARQPLLRRRAASMGICGGYMPPGMMKEIEPERHR